VCDPRARRPGPQAVSLRQELPRAFGELVHSPVGTDVAFRLGPEHLRDPRHWSSAVTAARLVLVPVHGAVLGQVRLRLDGSALSTFVADPTLGGLPVAPCPFLAPTWVGTHVLSVVAAGGLEVADRTADVVALDADRLEDLVFVLDFAVA
jgi:hypothetical protein